MTTETLQFNEHGIPVFTLPRKLDALSSCMLGTQGLDAATCLEDSANHLMDLLHHVHQKMIASDQYVWTFDQMIAHCSQANAKVLNADRSEITKPIPQPIIAKPETPPTPTDDMRHAELGHELSNLPESPEKFYAGEVREWHDAQRPRVGPLAPPAECAESDHIRDAGKMVELPAQELPAQAAQGVDEFDFDEAANKAAAVIRDIAMEYGAFESEDWIRALSDKISAQIRPGVQALYAKLQHRRCDTCGANTIDGCMRCGAPQCCPQCCKIDELERRLNSEDVAHTNTIDHRDTHEASINAICAALGMEEYDASWTSHNNPPERAIEYIEALQKEVEQLAVAKSLLAQSGARMFMFGDYEARLKDGKWSLQKYVMGSWVYQGEFSEPVQAALRAKELADVGKVGA